jgi:hypothetical protein
MFALLTEAADSTVFGDGCYTGSIASAMPKTHALLGDSNSPTSLFVSNGIPGILQLGF